MTSRIIAFAAFLALTNSAAAQRQCRSFPLDSGNPFAYNEFGTSVAISGNTLIVGATQEYNFDHQYFTGAAFVFTRDNPDTPNTFGYHSWTQIARIDPPALGFVGFYFPNIFGSSVAVSGDFIAVVDGRGDYQMTATGEYYFGAVYIYKKTGDTFIREARLVALGGTAAHAEELAQATVALDGTRLLVGAPNNQDLGQAVGAAYILERFEDGGAYWAVRARLYPTTPEEYGQFGTAVALDGDFAAVGAPSGAFGTAFVYRRVSETEWVPEATLQPEELVEGRHFGGSVGLSGDRLLVGAQFHETPEGNRGAVFAFRRETRPTPAWVQEEPILRPSDAKSTDYFGASAALSGEVAIIGSPGDASFAGSAYVFRLNDDGMWQETDKLTTFLEPSGRQMGAAAAIDGPYAVVGAPFPFASGPGSAHVYAVGDADDDSIADACEGFLIGEELPMPPGADPLRTSQTANAVDVPLRVFYYGDVYPTAPTGRFFANEAGVVTIDWRDAAGNPVGEVQYTIGTGAAVPDPARPYTIASTRYFKDWPTANVRFDTSATLTIRYNGTIRQDGDPITPGDQPHVQRLSNVLDVSANCPVGTVVLQYTDGPGGRLRGFEVANILNRGSPTGQVVSIGRKLPPPPGVPDGDFCRAAVLTNIATNGVPVAWQRTADSTDIYAIRDELDAARFAVGWYQETPFENCWPVEISRYVTTWPIDPQRYVVDSGAGDIALADLQLDGDYCRAEIMYQKGIDATPPGSTIVGGQFKSEREGYTVLRLDRQPSGQACGAGVAFDVVRSYDRLTPRSGNSGVFAGEFDWEIGTQITDAEHDGDTPDYPFGYLRSGQPHAPEIYQDTGQIFPVNSSDVHAMLEVWWFQEGTVYTPGVYWPHKSAKYRAVWPPARGVNEIVIASRLGAGPYPDDAEVYFSGLPGSNPAGIPGWNPNDEHAIVLPIAGSKRVFAVRDDNPRNAPSGHPFVLVKYHLPGSPLWAMSVHSVVGQQPPHDFDYDSFPSQTDPTDLIAVVAGLPIDPLFPVNFGAAACRTGTVPPIPQTTVAGDALWVDRAGGIWAVEQTHDDGTPGPSIATVYLWENWSADGGCQPWRAFFGGGNGTQPWPIVYRPSWPLTPPACNYPEDSSCARPLQVGETVNVSGQCGPLWVLHDSVGQRIIDPTHEVLVDYPALPSDADLAKLPPHLYGGEIGGGGIWPDRIRHTDRRLYFRGVMSGRDREYLFGLSADGIYRQRVSDLYIASRGQLNIPLANPAEKFVTVADIDAQAGWITLGFQNSRDCDPLPVSVEVWRVDCPPFQGAIRVIQPTCPFNEKIVLQFIGDAGGEPENLVYQWQWSTSRDGPWNDYSPPQGPQGCTDNLRNCYRHGVGLREVVIEGASPFTLADSWWRVRYRGYPACPGNINPDPSTPWAAQLNPGGSTQISEWTEPQLAEGWIKRVIRGINPFDQRVDDFHTTEAATYVNMIRQAGMRFEAPVALNCTPSNINNLGLIEVYETVLRRGRQFSIDQGLSYDPANVAILLVTSKIADLYMLLGNEAYADALDPTIGIFADQGPPPDTYDPHAVFCFENQLPSLLEEELALLRGRDQIRPPDLDADGVRVATVYNRLPWNFTSGDGQVAYANNYQVTSVADPDPNCGTPGHDPCKGARELYPQGHGDAWGHYLTAVKKFYALLRHPVYEWIVSTEAVLVGGQPVDVGFQYERSFAEAAAAKAKAGAAITSLTFRQRFDADPAMQDGYPDENAHRAWGVSEWSRRAGMGAYYDWVMANALLDDNDNNPDHANTIKKIDRTTVPELREIASAYLEVQASLDQADSGLNPLGLAANVVPFGLNPNEIEQGKSHFDQILERTLQALFGAVTAFNYANQNTQRLRSDQDQSEDFADLTAERERDFNGRLIEIFGRPYNEDVGLGRTYPPGYNGPDIYHFMYVEPTELIGIPTRTVTVSRQFTERSVNPQTGAATEASRLVSFNVSTDGLGFVRPDGWVARPEPGEMQFARSELLQAIGRFQQALDRYEAHLLQIDDEVARLQSEHKVNADRLVILRNNLGEQRRLNNEIISARGDQLELRTYSAFTRGMADATAEMLPTAIGFSNDVTAPLRGLAKMVGATVASSIDAFADQEAITELRRQVDLQLLAAQQNIDIVDLEGNARVRDLAASLRQLIRATPELRVELYTLQEAINQATGKFHAVVGKGLRLLEERTAFRQKTANQVSEYRYRDMAFRIFRNEALQKYREQFELAARYAYLAARAYDYETNLLGSDIQAGRDFLTGLVKERVLGVLAGQTPMVGTGLAGQLASLSANWQALRPQLGFNAPNELNRTFNMRWELFRLPNSVGFDAEWKDRLQRSVVPDLNALQEYTQYCQPLQPPIPNNPAIVLPFSTTVQSQLNLFGWPSSGDATLPSDRFAIKVHSYGVRFSNYPGSPLNRQVNVYLVPVGADVMRVPSCPVAPTRQWQLLDQTLPVPFPISNQDLVSPTWTPWDSLSGGSAGLVRRRLIPTVAGCSTDDVLCTDTSFKLTGRSIWNTRWLLIIPGSELQGANPANGITVFINGNTPGGTGVRDIKLPIKSYGYSGCLLTAEEPPASFGEE